jgi:hypothetical protein
MEYMTPLQIDRYATYRRIRLKRETVRKLVNQTLSQSVPQPVIIAVTSYAKSFIGDLIDRALTVRDEWTVSSTHLANGALPPAVLMQSLQRPSAHIKDERNRPTNQDISQAGVYINQVDRSETLWKEIQEDASLQERLNQSNKGPLTPAHLREALRRYKRDRDGGGAGFAGMSLEGVENDGKNGRQEAVSINGRFLPREYFTRRLFLLEFSTLMCLVLGFVHVCIADGVLGNVQYVRSIFKGTLTFHTRNVFLLHGIWLVGTIVSSCYDS